MRLRKLAEFFSFGTNDLTQTTFGISRDDASSFLDDLQQKGHHGAGSVRHA
jgi:pyruvate,orthophosphate dikinase